MVAAFLLFLVCATGGAWAVWKVATAATRRYGFDPLMVMLELGLAEWPTEDIRPGRLRDAPRAAPASPRRRAQRAAHTRWVEEILWRDPAMAAPAGSARSRRGAG